MCCTLKFFTGLTFRFIQTSTWYGRTTMLSTDGVDNLDKLLQIERSLGYMSCWGILS